jgi:hypothetical protein
MLHSIATYIRKIYILLEIITFTENSDKKNDKMKNKYFIFFMLLTIISNVNAQTISRKSVSSGGGTLMGGTSQITFTIGETFNSSLSAVSTVITQGFQQPGESVRAGNVSTSICTGSSFKLSYTAIDIAGGNTFTAQLSNAAGSFANPVNIGTLAGNASVSEINITIPSNIVAGKKYRIRVTSSSPAYIGTDNGSDISLIQGATASISYSGSPYCTSDKDKAKVTMSGQSKGTYSSSAAGLSIDSKSGDIDLAASVPGTYTVDYNYDNGNCSNTAKAVVTINALPTATITYGQSSFCSAGSVDVLREGQQSGTYTASPSGLSINHLTGRIDLEKSSKGKYDVTYSYSNGKCGSTATTVVNIDNCKNERPVLNVIAYPNPTNYQFTLVLEDGSNEKVEIMVYDMLGRLVKRNESKNEESIQFGEDLRAGTYRVIISQGKNQKTIILIKND